MADGSFNPGGGGRPTRRLWPRRWTAKLLLSGSSHDLILGRPGEARCFQRDRVASGLLAFGYPDLTSDVGGLRMRAPRLGLNLGAPSGSHE
jgi:hypothetical protein